MIRRNISFRRAFTLIELLVVISIIALISSLVISSVNNAKIKSRVVQRLQDVRQLQTAFQLAVSGAGSFINVGGGWSCISVSCTGAWSGYTANSTVDNFIIPTYLPKKIPFVSSPALDRGGYMYTGASGGGVGASGITFPSGVYIDWVTEGPYNSNPCGSGSPWTGSSNPNIECLLKID